MPGPRKDGVNPGFYPEARSTHPPKLLIVGVILEDYATPPVACCCQHDPGFVDIPSDIRVVVGEDRV